MMDFGFEKYHARKHTFAAKRSNGCGFEAALRTEDGAIDLASIMVGVIVIGVIAGVIAATVFAVIPWSQDRAAGQALDAVNQAESVAFAQSTDAGAGAYLDKANIISHDGAGNTPGLLQDSDSVSIKSTGPSYIAVSKSPTGKYFASTSANPNTAVPYASIAALNAAFPSLTTNVTVTTNDDPFLAGDFS